MTDRIEPALTSAAWAEVLAGDGIPYAYGSSVLDELTILEGADIPVAIAFLNYALPDDDPRKITREQIAAIRFLASDSENYGKPDSVRPYMRWARQLADALESYLPPVT